MAATLICLMLVVSLAKLSCAQSCQVNDVKIKSDLDLKKMEGRWFELKWRSYSFVPEELRFRDYEHSYKYDYATGDLIVNGQGRPTLHADCFTYSGSLKHTMASGKLIYTRPNSVFNAEGTVSSDYWIVDTDYVNYALSYGCRQILFNGTCHPEKVESWLWGRNPSLPHHLTHHVERLMEDLCLEPESYLATPHGHACSKPPVNSAVHIAPMGYVFLVTFLILRVAL